jgi:hypothetical protein
MNYEGYESGRVIRIVVFHWGVDTLKTCACVLETV